MAMCCCDNARPFLYFGGHAHSERTLLSQLRHLGRPLTVAADQRVETGRHSVPVSPDSRHLFWTKLK